MAEWVPFQLKLTGDTADQHQFQGYDGYMGLAGFAWTLALAANYAETGELRHRGDFPGRHAVRARPLAQGSVVADFGVWLSGASPQMFGLAAASGVAGAAFFHELVRRIISRNLGNESDVDDPLLRRLLETRGGDVEALVAATEPAVRQTHSVIGNGANEMLISGGLNLIGRYNHETKAYVSQNVEDRGVHDEAFSVSAFNANSGYGSVFDANIGRVIPIGMSRELLREVRSVFTWGLDQYANRTGGKVRMRYWRILAMDGRPKRYMVVAAERA